MNAPYCPHGIPIAEGVVCADCADRKMTRPLTTREIEGQAAVSAGIKRFAAKQNAEIASGIAAHLTDAIIAERDDPRNSVEHAGFRAGMTRAIAVIRQALEQ